MATKVTLAGQTKKQPGWLSQTIVDTAGNIPLTDYGILCLIGEASGGSPNTAYEFTDWHSAKEIFGSGALADAVRIAFSPSKDTRIPGAPLKVIAIKSNESTRSAMYLRNRTPSRVLRLASLNYGVATRTINAEIDLNPSDSTYNTVTATIRKSALAGDTVETYTVGTQSLMDAYVSGPAAPVVLTGCDSLSADTVDATGLDFTLTVNVPAAVVATGGNWVEIIGWTATGGGIAADNGTQLYAVRRVLTTGVGGAKHFAIDKPFKNSAAVDIANGNITWTVRFYKGRTSSIKLKTLTSLTALTLEGVPSAVAGSYYSIATAVGLAADYDNLYLRCDSGVCQGQIRKITATGEAVTGHLVLTLDKELVVPGVSPGGTIPTAVNTDIVANCRFSIINHTGATAVVAGDSGAATTFTFYITTGIGETNATVMQNEVLTLSSYTTVQDLANALMMLDMTTKIGWSNFITARPGLGRLGSLSPSRLDFGVISSGTIDLNTNVVMNYDYETIVWGGTYSSTITANKAYARFIDHLAQLVDAINDGSSIVEAERVTRDDVSGGGTGASNIGDHLPNYTGGVAVYMGANVDTSNLLISTNKDYTEFLADEIETGATGVVVSAANIGKGMPHNSTITSLTAAFTKALKVRKNVTVPLWSLDATDSAFTINDVHQALLSHIIECNAIGQNEGEGIIAYAPSSTDALAYNILKTKRAAMNSKDLALVFQSPTRENIDGVLTLFQPHMTAVIMGALQCAAPLGTDLTYKYPNFYDLSTPATIDTEDKTVGDDLIDNRIVFFKKDSKNNYRMVSNLSTWATDETQEYTDRNVNEILLYIAYDLRTSLEDKFTGEQATPSTLNGVKSYITNDKCERYKTQLQVLTDGIDPSTGLFRPAYTVPTLAYANGILTVKLDVSPVGSIRYGTLTITAKVPNLQA